MGTNSHFTKRRISSGSSTVQAVFLDFDGVVVESADIKTQAFQHLFSLEPPSQVQRILRYHDRCMGVSRYVKFSHIFKTILRRPLTSSIQQALGRQFARFAKERVIACPLVRGADRFLSRWSDLAALYLVSGTPQAELREIVRRRGLSKYFRGIFGSPRTKGEIIGGILSRMKYDRRRVVFVGDAMTDLRAASLVGIPFVGRASRSQCFHPFRPPVVRDLNALDQWLTTSMDRNSWM